MQNPVAAFQYLVSLELFDWPTHIAEIAAWGVSNPELALAAVPAIAPIGAVGGFGGLAGLAGIAQPVVVAAAPVAAPALVPIVATPTGFTAPVVAAGAPPPPGPPPGPPAPTAPAPTPPPTAAGAGFVPPYFVFPPGIGSRSAISSSASASAKKKAPEPDSAAVAAAAAERAAARARRRRSAKQRGHGNEYMDMNLDVDPDWGAPPGRSAGRVDAGLGSGCGKSGVRGHRSKGSQGHGRRGGGPDHLGRRRIRWRTQDADAAGHLECQWGRIRGSGAG